MVNDIIQSAYIEFLKEATLVEDQNEFHVLLRRVTRRVAKRLWDERYRQAPEMLEKVARRMAQLASSHFDELYFEDEILALNICLSKLPEKSRKLVQQHYLDGKSIALLSREYKVVPRVLYKSIFRIREKLRSCINIVLKKGVQNV